MDQRATSPIASPGWRHVLALPGRILDLGAVLALFGIGAIIFLASTHSVPGHLSAGRIPAYGVVLIAVASLLVRRTHPMVTWGAIVVAMLIEATLGTASIMHPFLLVAVYNVAARLQWRAGIVLAAAAALLFSVLSALPGQEFSVVGLVTTTVAAAGAYVVGRYVRMRADYITALHERAEYLERENELLAESAVAQERVRIARELHDVVAHNLSLVIVQASALQTQVPADGPAHVTAGNVADTGRRAMDDMRRMLGVLRLGGADHPEHAPQPGIAEIPDLIREIRNAGVTVDLTIAGEAGSVSPGVGLTLYRITQEALTNVLRHAGPVHCRVSISREGDVVELRVTDDGPGDAAAATPGGGGHGLIGMRERVAAFGGELFAGPVPGGGFAVRATLTLRAGDGG